MSLYYNKDGSETAEAGTRRTVESKVRRHPERAAYDRKTIDAILDEGLVGHLGFTSRERPYVLPMLYVRDGDVLYLHGAPASRLLGTLAGGVPCCFTVTLLDGLVLARSAFHHSLNYRSVVGERVPERYGCGRGDRGRPVTRAGADPDARDPQVLGPRSRELQLKPAIHVHADTHEAQRARAPSSRGRGPDPPPSW